eukprot:scaffold53649_cov83-Phaeocystis_antarctica.AAC.1
MEANAPPAGSWNRRLRPPGPRAGARNLASLSPLPWRGTVVTPRTSCGSIVLTKMLRPFSLRRWRADKGAPNPVAGRFQLPSAM